ncbi:MULTISPECIES: universal stress protein [unclassified Enterococcus]|uniref:universal stress protein n=1 Tax=unclassified Enterococcus TaxID=2608891 RepID=UPI001552E8C9|nr:MULTISPECIES: universal stress protein [unclassified Enterococcus]MBS7577341.1 universal stress protein [Enterococcus sp. MMGLQ5-2]MBS7584748.1 universal stress protein [Enterococcus sp. MMGLQ5-1]NPD12603.1 universal stress protein [Enterococcus sp. MMGLQ5-1]NPD37175.1 universal stress protein [Enterococcus sp. MMGLQ5-2]
MTTIKNQEYQNILIAIDGSDESDVAFNKAMNVAKRNNTALIIAHIVDTRAFQSVSSFDGTLADEATQAANKILDEHIDRAKSFGVTNVKKIIEFGSPKSLIATKIPEKENIGLIMLGATGLNTIERLLIGSVSEYVIRHAPCDVLIVRNKD